MSIPRSERPWGIVTWMSDTFGLSRPSVYNVTSRIQEQLTVGDKGAVEEVESQPEASYRLERTVLTGAFPGKMSLRPMQAVLSEAIDESRSVGWLSGLLNDAGRQAGEVLAGIDTSPLGAVIVARDETFFQGIPILLVIDPVSTTILLTQASEDRQADTWGLALLSAQEQGAKIAGLVEDMARMYPKSQDEIGLDVNVQKDTWHIERDGAQVLRNLERSAFRATKQVLALEKKLRKAWDETLFLEKYIPAVATEERRYDQHAAFAQALDHLCDALEIVDWRSGEIRNPATAQWYLEETLTRMATIDHYRVQKWSKTLRNHQHQLLTALDWLNSALEPLRTDLRQHCPTAELTLHFERTVARTWRLQQALINGHQRFQSLAQQAQDALDTLIYQMPVREQLAQQITRCLDAACRTSSLIECLNGLLKQFLHNRRTLPDLPSLQRYLNLFTLWHNMRVYQRGKRQGLSPYQIASIDTDDTDWLTLLGYPDV
ncbi:hypothetical protein KFU94_16115 [Chloroflexi bacterium TSY]|nr:hypothetical protein [Chloroflexi bacterium TSY]